MAESTIVTIEDLDPKWVGRMVTDTGKPEGEILEMANTIAKGVAKDYEGMPRVRFILRVKYDLDDTLKAEANMTARRGCFFSTRPPRNLSGKKKDTVVKKFLSGDDAARNQMIETGEVMTMMKPEVVDGKTVKRKVAVSKITKFDSKLKVVTAGEEWKEGQEPIARQMEKKMVTRKDGKQVDIMGQGDPLKDSWQYDVQGFSYPKKEPKSVKLFNAVVKGNAANPKHKDFVDPRTIPLYKVVDFLSATRKKDEENRLDGMELLVLPRDFMRRLTLPDVKKDYQLANTIETLPCIHILPLADLNFAVDDLATRKGKDFESWHISRVKVVSIELNSLKQGNLITITDPSIKGNVRIPFVPDELAEKIDFGPGSKCYLVHYLYRGKKTYDSESKESIDVDAGKGDVQIKPLAFHCFERATKEESESTASSNNEDMSKYYGDGDEE